VRLFDRIVQTRVPLLVARGAEVVRLPGPAAYSAAIAACPLRLVLTDSLTRVCTALAYAEGDRLSGCLDLIHVPATRFWVEWRDAPRCDAASAALGLVSGAEGANAGRAGLYVTAEPSGRRGRARTFWGPADGEGEACLAPLVTEFDLDAADETAGSIDDVFAGGAARLATDDAALADVLRCVRFRFDDSWAAYYRLECATPAARESVLRASLAAVGTDLPVLFALCLLLGSRLRLPARRPDLARINRCRVRDGHPVLLDHVEVTVPVMSTYANAASAGGSRRHMPRLHHVRGHLVRRGSQVFWRVPHLRGRAAFGRLRARSVTLHFESHSRVAAGAEAVSAFAAAPRREHASSLPGGPP
jgi:hypothetical protein